MVSPYSASAAERRPRKGNREDPEDIMIRTDTEYEDARSRLLDEKKRLSEHEVRMKEMGLGLAEIKRAIDPLRSSPLQLEEEVKAYERMQRGSFEPIRNLAGLGQLL